MAARKRGSREEASGSASESVSDASGSELSVSTVGNSANDESEDSGLEHSESSGSSSTHARQRSRPRSKSQRLSRASSSRRSAQHRLVTLPKKRESSRSSSSSSSWSARERHFERFRASALVLPVPDSVTRIEKARGWSLQISSVTQWVVPEVLLRGTQRLRGHAGNNTTDATEGSSSDDDDEPLLTVGVHVSFFHSASKRFFGNTWISPELAIDPFQLRAERDPKSTSVRYVVDHVPLNFRAYFLSEIVDSSCVGIVELVAYEKDPDSKATVASAGCGWTILPLFTQQQLATTAQDATATSSGESVSVFMGTPRVLWEFSGPTEWQTHPKYEGCKFRYQMQVYDPLLALGTGGFLRRHELVGALDVIPGLRHGNLASIDAGTNPKVALLRGLEEDKAGGSSDDTTDDITAYTTALAAFVRMASFLPQSLQFAESFTLDVVASRVFVHLREEVESNLITRLRLSRKTRHAGATAIDGHVSARVLKIALHNGRCFRTRQHTVPLKTSGTMGDDALQCVPNRTHLKGFVFHPFMAIVVALQFTVHFRVTWPPKMRQQALEATPKQVLPEEDVVLVTMGSRILVPSDGKRLFLHGRADEGLAPVSSDDSSSRVLHVDLLNGAASRPYTENPVYVPPDHLLNDLNAVKGPHRHQNKGGATESFAFVDLHLLVSGDMKSSLSQDNESKPRSNQQEDASPHAAEHWAKRILAKADANSVLAQTLNSLATTKPLPTTPTNTENHRPASPTKQVTNGPKSTPATQASLPPVPVLPTQRLVNAHINPNIGKPLHDSTTELSRASKTLLMRHGFLDAHESETKRPGFNKKMQSEPTQRAILEAELKDIYKANEIRIHFAAYRSEHIAGIEGGSVSRAPARVYFTFQFYRFPPTRTETLRLSNAVMQSSTQTGSATQTYLLMRENPANKPSLAIQFDVDTTATQDPLEPQHFAEYLLRKRLYVDVWDAESRFHLGTCVIPLKALLRQGSGIKKYHGEAEILESVGMQRATSTTSTTEGRDDSLEGDDVGYNNHKEASCVGLSDVDDVRDLTSSAPSVRKVIGRLQFLMSNYGLRGRNIVQERQEAEAAPTTGASLTPVSGVGPTHRIKHRVRARPLIETNSELYQLLAQEGFYGNRQSPGLKEQSSEEARRRHIATRRTSDGTSLTSREIDILCERFRVGNGASHSTRIACDREGKRGLTALLSLRTPAVAINEATKSTSPPDEAAEKTREHSERLRRVLRSAVATHALDLEQAFALFDKDHDGSLSPQEWIEAMRSLGAVFAELSDAELLELARQLDVDRDGRIAYREFMAFALTQDPNALRDHVKRVLGRAVDKGIAIHHVFQMFDSSGDGKLSYDECVRALAQLGVEAKPPEALTTWLRSWDLDGDGSISYDEFLTSLGISRAENRAEVVATTTVDMRATLREVLTRLQSLGIALDELFEHFDRDRNGTLELDEFVAAVRQCLQLASNQGDKSPLQEMKDDALRNVIQEINKNGDGVIDYKEFLSVVGLTFSSSSIIKSKRVRAERKLFKVVTRALSAGLTLAEIFAPFDRDADGQITAAEFERTFEELFGKSFAKSESGNDDESVAKLIAHQLDANGDGHISKSEFRTLVEEVERLRTKLTTELKPHIKLLQSRDGECIPIEMWKAFCKDEMGWAAKKVDTVSQDLERLAIMDEQHRVDVHEVLLLVTITSVPRKDHQNQDVGTRLRELLERAASQGVDVSQSFAHFDVDGDGEVTMSELTTALLALGCFDDVHTKDISDLLSSLDEDKSGKISFVEFKKLLPVNSSSSSRATVKQLERDSTVILNDLKALLASAMAKGVDVHACFRHFDKDNSGTITRDEFVKAMPELGLATDADAPLLRELLDVLDRDKSGEISLSEFKQLFPPEATIAVVQSHTSSSHAPPGNETANRLRELLTRAQEHGIDVAKSFAHFDQDGDGRITTLEFQQALRGLQGFETVTDGELAALISSVDRDASGSISLEEFREFARSDPVDSVGTPNVATTKPENAAATVAPNQDSTTKLAEPEKAPQTEPPLGNRRSDDITTAVDEKKSDDEGRQNVDAKTSPVTDDRALDASNTQRGDSTTTLPTSDTKAVQKKPPLTRASSLANRGKQQPPAARRSNTDTESVASAVAESTGPAKKPPAGRRPSLAETRAAVKAAAAAKSAGGSGAGGTSVGTADNEAAGRAPIPLGAIRGLDNLHVLLSRALGSGVDVQTSFNHFDKAKSGQVSYEEFANGLPELGTEFQETEKADLLAISKALDKTQRGHLEATDLSAFVESPRVATAKVGAAEKPRAAEAAPNEVLQSAPSPSEDAKAAVAAPKPRSNIPNRRPSAARSTVAVAKAAAKTAATAAGRVSASSESNQNPDTSKTAKEASTPRPTGTKGETTGPPTTDATGPTVHVGGSATNRGKDTTSETTASAPAGTTTAPVGPSLRFTKGQSDATPSASDLYECAYEFSTDPEIRAVEVKLRRVAIDAYSRGILPMRLIHRFLEGQPRARRTKAHATPELLRVEFLQILMELGFSLLSDDTAMDDDDGGGSGGLSSAAQSGRRLHDHLYARQLERLARYKHHIREESRAQKTLLRAVRHAQRRPPHLHAGPGQPPSVQRFVEDKSQLLRVLSYYRDGHKKSLVYSLLREQVTTTISLCPSFASLLFLELPFANPYPHSERFRLEFLGANANAATAVVDAEIVTNSAEWRYYRQHVPLAYGLQRRPRTQPPPHGRASGGGGATAERVSYAGGADDDVDDGDDDVEHEMIDPQREVVLEASDRIPVPVRLRWLHATMTSTASSARPPTTLALAVKSCTHGHTVALFRLELRPQPFVCHRVLRFAHPGNSVWRWRLRCPRGRFVVCMDPRVALDVGEQAEGDRDRAVTLTLRCRVGPYPALEEFYVVLYEDEYFARVDEIWQLRIQATLRVDAHTLLGQPVRSELVVRGDPQRPRRHVRCCTTWHHAGHLAFRPGHVFELLGDAYNRIEWAFCAVGLPAPGLCRALVHLVDVETHELVGAWTLQLSLGRPTITKSYALTLPRHEAAQKKIAYTNPWDEPQTVVLRSSDPRRLRPRDAALAIPPRGQVFLRLVFPVAASVAGLGPRGRSRNELLLFINDQRTEQNEECLRFEVDYRDG